MKVFSARVKDIKLVPTSSVIRTGSRMVGGGAAACNKVRSHSSKTGEMERRAEAVAATSDRDEFQAFKMANNA